MHIVQYINNRVRVRHRFRCDYLPLGTISGYWKHSFSLSFWCIPSDYRKCVCLFVRWQFQVAQKSQYKWFSRFGTEIFNGTVYGLITLNQIQNCCHSNIRNHHPAILGRCEFLWKLTHNDQFGNYKRFHVVCSFISFLMTHSLCSHQHNKNRVCTIHSHGIKCHHAGDNRKLSTTAKMLLKLLHAH